MPALPVGGFMPIPLAMMIPFMATQSLIMGDAFGKGYQFGKRRISSLTNEEFNKLNISDLISQMTQDFKTAIPHLEQSISDSSELQSRIIREMLLIIPKMAVSDELWKPEPFNVAGAPTVGGAVQNITGVDLSAVSNAMAGFFKSLTIPKAYGFTPTTNAITSDTLIPEFGDQSPPSLNDPENDPEFIRAKNELAYKKAQEDKALQLRIQQLDAERAARNKPTAQAIRKTSIAESGLSSLAAKAVATFKQKIDNWKAILEDRTQKQAAYNRWSGPMQASNHEIISANQK